MKSAKTAVPAEMKPDDKLGRKQVCEILGISKRTFHNYTHPWRGNPPLLSSILYRGKRVVRRGVVDYFLKSRETKGQY